MGHGILRVDLKPLEGALHLPEGYELVSAHYDPMFRQIQLLVESEALPETPEGGMLPALQLFITVECATHPDGSANTEYRKYTGRIEKD